VLGEHPDRIDQIETGIRELVRCQIALLESKLARGDAIGADRMTPIDDTLVETLRAERLADAGRTGLAARRRDWHLNRG